MIELFNNRLNFTFPEVHPKAKLAINLLRTLRLPDDGRTYPLPPGHGSFPMRHVDDFADTVPPKWLERGGVMLPMFQSEALWMNFQTFTVRNHQVPYPFAIKVAAGKINAVTGDLWRNPLGTRPQDYLVSPTQPWLDGFCTENGIIRQFVAMPLGDGYTAEEQITGQAQHGGLQIIVYPMKREAFERRFPKRNPFTSIGWALGGGTGEVLEPLSAPLSRSDAPDMGLAPGGRMRQHIFHDLFQLDDWDQDNSSRCFLHIANSSVWKSITGQAPPMRPPSAKAYSQAGLPWFEYYGQEQDSSVSGSKILNALKSISQMALYTGKSPLPENESAAPQQVVSLGLPPKDGKVRDGTF